MESRLPASSSSRVSDLFPMRQLFYGTAGLLAITLLPLVIWPGLLNGIFTSNFLPHSYCYLGRPGVVWTHVTADSLIGLSYLMIS